MRRSDFDFTIDAAIRRFVNNMHIERFVEETMRSTGMLWAKAIEKIKRIQFTGFVDVLLRQSH